MKFLQINIANFLTIHKNATIDLADRGLVLIQGDNQGDTSADSNGAGKSSVVDAVSWCLYGTTARGVSGDSVVNRKAKKDCVVSISVDDANAHYLITRSRKPNNLTVVETDKTTGVDKDLTKGTDKETQSVINRVVGSSLDVFLASVYAGQEAMPDLPGMTDKQLKVLIEEAAGIEVITQAYALARDEVAAQTAKVTTRRSQVSNLETQRTNAESRKSQAEARRDLWTTENLQVVQELAKQARFQKAERDDQQTALNVRDKPKAEADLAAVQAKIALLDPQKVKKADLEAKATAAQRALNAAMLPVGIKSSAVAAAQSGLDNIDKKVGSPCGSCGKKFEEHDMATAKSHAEAHLASCKKELEEAKVAARPLKAAHDAAVKAYDDHVASMSDPTELIEEQSRAQTVLNHISELERRVQTALSNMTNLVAQAKAKQAEVNPHQASIDAEAAALHKLDVEIDLTQKHLDIELEELEVAKEALAVFGPAGVRAHILDTVTPLLNEKTSEYLGALSDGAITAVWSTLGTTTKGELREKFNIEVTHTKGADSFAGLSGGEKRKVRLACFMAHQDLVATRATKPIDLLIADEIDHALDEAGLERLMSVLEKKARERGTVLVISHNSLGDWIDTVITVVKEEPFVSRVEGAACV